MGTTAAAAPTSCQGVVFTLRTGTRGLRAAGHRVHLVDLRICNQRSGTVEGFPRVTVTLD